MVQVSGADHCGTLPGKNEHRAAVRGVQHGHGLRHRQAVIGKHQVAAAQRTDMFFTPDLLAQLVGPGPGGIDHHPGADVDAGIAEHIASAHARHLTRLIQQALHGHIIEQLDTVCADRLIQDSQYQARIVGGRVGILAGALESFRLQVRRLQLELVGRQESMIPPPGKKVVDIQQRGKGPATGKLPLAAGKKVGQRRHQAGGLPQQALALHNRFTGSPEVAAGDVAQAAVHHFRGAAGSAPGKILALQQQHLEIQPGRLAQHPGANNTAAHHHHIPVGLALLRQ